MPKELHDCRYADLLRLPAPQLARIHLASAAAPVALADGLVTGSIGDICLEMRTCQKCENADFFAPMYCAFSVLDQLGGVYVNLKRPIKPADQKKTPGVIKALHYFHEMPYNEGEASALYKLRNALVHYGNLTYKDRQTAPEYYLYRANKNIRAPIILASSPWDGDWGNLSPATTMQFNVQEICRLAENSVAEVKKVLNDGNLGIEIGNKDFLYQYLNFFPNQ